MSIPYILFTKMAKKCILMSCWVVLMVITTFVCVFSFLSIYSKIDNNTSSTLTVIYPTGEGYTMECICDIFDISLELKASSLQSFARSLATGDDSEFRLNALAVYSNLTSACEPLHDVNKAKLGVHKIALVTLVSQTACPLRDLAVSAQNAGYSMLIYFNSILSDVTNGSYAMNGSKLLIPVLNAADGWHCPQIADEEQVSDYPTEDPLLVADQTDVLIRVHILPHLSNELSKIKPYLQYNVFFFFAGPLITVLWLIGSKKLCWMSGGIIVDKQAARTEIPRIVEEGQCRNEELRLSSVDGETTGNGRDGERQPLLISLSSHEFATLRQGTRARSVKIIRKILSQIVVGVCYLIVIIAALPVGVSSLEGWSFFRFDRGEASLFSGKEAFFRISRKYDEWITRNGVGSRGNVYIIFPGESVFWPTFQIFCFFTYSAVACKATWIVQTNFSKLIRSDWLASNIFLLVLGIVVPCCTFSLSFAKEQRQLVKFATYNTVCTASNFLFILILNKHKFVTRYVFFASICMICAYIESDIVALFFFALNYQGSLNNLKLTALRTVAIGYTLTISFSSSMHIIRKLAKPRESLFEGLSEK